VNDHDVTVVLERLIEPLDEEVGSWDDVLRRAAEPSLAQWDEGGRGKPARDSRSALEPIGDGKARHRRRRRVLVLAMAALVVVTTSVAAALATERGVFFGTLKPVARGTEWRNVDGIRFSFKVPRGNPPTSWAWENGPIVHVSTPPARAHSLFLSKSTVGGQSAEAVIFWTTFPSGGEALPCSAVLSPATGRSTDALARAMARAPGVKLLARPTRVTIGGRPARHLVVTVRRKVGCDPGFFFSWQPSAPDGECWGACWLEASVGDRVNLWIVDVHGKLLIVEAETTQPGSHGRPPGTPVTRADVRTVEAEIEKIVGSIRFG
jgi:hypothetical protein